MISITLINIVTHIVIKCDVDYPSENCTNFAMRSLHFSLYGNGALHVYITHLPSPCIPFQLPLLKLCAVPGK